MSQILDLAVVDEHFDRVEGFDLADYWSAYLVDFHARLYHDTATLRLTPAGMQRLRQSMPPAVLAAVKETATMPDDHGRVTAVIPIESISHAASGLLGLGAEVEVLAPQSLRREMEITALAVAAMYSPDRRCAPTGSQLTCARPPIPERD